MPRADRRAVAFVSIAAAPIAAYAAMPPSSSVTTEITSPTDHARAAWYAAVGYAAAAIHDGKSTAFDELPASSVVVEARNVADVTAAGTLPRTLPPALSMMSQSNCAGCHQFVASGAGPSYEAIAKRYAGHDDASADLALHIRAGSRGRWGPAAMPPHGDLSPADARAIADWIVAHGADPTVHYAIGTQGAFRMTPAAGAGSNSGMVLTAYYAGPLASVSEARSAGPRSRIVVLGAGGR